MGSFSPGNYVWENFEEFSQHCSSCVGWYYRNTNPKVAWLTSRQLLVLKVFVHNGLCLRFQFCKVDTPHCTRSVRRQPTGTYHHYVQVAQHSQCPHLPYWKGTFLLQPNQLVEIFHRKMFINIHYIILHFANLWWQSKSSISFRLFTQTGLTQQMDKSIPPTLRVTAVGRSVSEHLWYWATITRQQEISVTSWNSDPVMLTSYLWYSAILKILQVKVRFFVRVEYPK